MWERRFGGLDWRVRHVPLRVAEDRLCGGPLELLRTNKVRRGVGEGLSAYGDQVRIERHLGLAGRLISIQEGG